MSRDYTEHSLIGSEPDAIRARLRILPRALGYPTNSAFARALGVGVSRYNMAINLGKISNKLADTIYQNVTGMRVEWLRYGDRMAMSDHLWRKIETALSDCLEDSPRRSSRARR